MDAHYFSLVADVASAGKRAITTEDGYGYPYSIKMMDAIPLLEDTAHYFSHSFISDISLKLLYFRIFYFLSFQRRMSTGIKPKQHRFGVR
jgi:hypothetical protein